MTRHTFKQINESNRKLLAGLSATTWRHKKTGNLYVIDSLTMLQADYKPYDERTLVNYHSLSEEEGAASCMFSRLLAEFMCKFVPVHKDAVSLDLSLQLAQMVKDTIDSVFAQTLSNGLFDAWGQPINCGKLNELNRLAGEMLKGGQ